MTNAQLYILLTPALVSLFGVFFSAWRTDKRIDDLRQDMKEELKAIRTTIELIQRDLRDFYATQKAHDEAIDTLKKQVKL